eukprot:10397685-Karenia_brevis.AAC.1
MGARIIRAIAKDEPPALMRCPNNQWPQADNNPTIGVELDYQSVLEIESSTANLVWTGEHVQIHGPPPPPPWKPAVERGTP